MLADDEAVTSAMLGESGAIRALGKKCVQLGMSTGERCALEAAGRAPTRGRAAVRRCDGDGSARVRALWDAGDRRRRARGGARALPADLRHPLEADGSRRARARARQRDSSSPATWWLATILESLARRRAGGELRCRTRPAVPRVLNGAVLKSPVDRGLWEAVAEAHFEPPGFHCGRAPGTLRLASRRARRWRCRCRCERAPRRFVAAIAHGKKAPTGQAWAGSAPRSREANGRPPIIGHLKVSIFGSSANPVGGKRTEAVHRLKGVEVRLARRGRLTKRLGTGWSCPRSDHLSALAYGPGLTVSPFCPTPAASVQLAPAAAHVACCSFGRCPSGASIV